MNKSIRTALLTTAAAAVVVTAGTAALAQFGGGDTVTATMNENTHPLDELGTTG